MASDGLALTIFFPASRIRRSIARYLASIRSFESSLISGVAFSPIASDTEQSMDGFSCISYVPKDFCSSSADLHGVTSQPPNLRIAPSIFRRTRSKPQYQIPPRSPPTVLKNRSVSWKVPSLKNSWLNSIPRENRKLILKLKISTSWILFSLKCSFSSPAQSSRTIKGRKRTRFSKFSV